MAPVSLDARFKTCLRDCELNSRQNSSYTARCCRSPAALRVPLAVDLLSPWCRYLDAISEEGEPPAFFIALCRTAENSDSTRIVPTSFASEVLPTQTAAAARSEIERAIGHLQQLRDRIVAAHRSYSCNLTPEFAFKSTNISPGDENDHDHFTELTESDTISSTVSPSNLEALLNAYCAYYSLLIAYQAHVEGAATPTSLALLPPAVGDALNACLSGVKYSWVPATFDAKKKCVVQPNRSNSPDTPSKDYESSGFMGGIAQFTVSVARRASALVSGSRRNTLTTSEKSDEAARIDSQTSPYYESASVLYNIGAICNALGHTAFELNTVENLRKSSTLFLRGAGAFKQLAHLLRSSSCAHQISSKSPELHPDCCDFLSKLCLARATECSWAMANFNSFTSKSGATSVDAVPTVRPDSLMKIAAKVSSLFADSAACAKSSAVSGSLLGSWAEHSALANQRYYHACAEFLAANSEYAMHNIGLCIARLQRALNVTEKACGVCSLRGAMLLENISQITRLVLHDNDTVYFDPVPSHTSLDPVPLPRIVLTGDLVSPPEPSDAEFDLVSCIPVPTTVANFLKFTRKRNVLLTTIAKLWDSVMDRDGLRQRRAESAAASFHLISTFDTALRQLELACAEQVSEAEGALSGLDKIRKMLESEQVEDEFWRKQWGIRWTRPNSAVAQSFLQSEIRALVRLIHSTNASLRHAQANVASACSSSTSLAKIRQNNAADSAVSCPKSVSRAASEVLRHVTNLIIHDYPSTMYKDGNLSSLPSYEEAHRRILKIAESCNANEELSSSTPDLDDEDSAARFAKENTVGDPLAYSNAMCARAHAAFAEIFTRLAQLEKEAALLVTRRRSEGKKMVQSISPTTVVSYNRRKRNYDTSRSELNYDTARKKQDRPSLDSFTTDAPQSGKALDTDFSLTDDEKSQDSFVPGAWDSSMAPLRFNKTSRHK